MHTEDNLLSLSALQHIIFCERQCALIHIEQVWAENLFTAEGKILHERVDSGESESRGRVKIEYALPIRSLELGVIGKADVVEFHYATKKSQRISQVKPVEYKRGKPKADNCDKVQLCAQAMCLEEMLDIEIPDGDLFYGKQRRRQNIIFDNELRTETRDAAKRLHDLIRSGLTPPAVYTQKCRSCSLLTFCLPKISGKNKNVNNYLDEMMGEI
ncbi:CRISPR-associated protein Cas4 [Desulfonema magnum]|uniref:CRISPR-associated exonuclease Cas4 n=1 Tax=Desulfonema magnum TaxID=45655 RepID=A0A975GU86_9BACT|nr:CRISPR-associated protein Cas4 [Desulfonema magnum]QTA93777.1 CRISPR-associated protein Cas4 [Desulfonema magnum]